MNHICWNYLSRHLAKPNNTQEVNSQSSQYTWGSDLTSSLDENDVSQHRKPSHRATKLWDCRHLHPYNPGFALEPIEEALLSPARTSVEVPPRLYYYFHRIFFPKLSSEDHVKCLNGRVQAWVVRQHNRALYFPFHDNQIWTSVHSKP